MARSAAGKRSFSSRAIFYNVMKKLHGLQIMIGLAIFGGRIPGMIEIALRVNVFGQVLRLMLDTIAPKSHITFIAM